MVQQVKPLLRDTCVSEYLVQVPASNLLQLPVNIFWEAASSGSSVFVPATPVGTPILNLELPAMVSLSCFGNEPADGKILSLCSAFLI